MLKLKILIPVFENVIEHEVASVTMTNENGIFQVLPGHMNFVTNLTTSPIEIITNDKKKLVYFISGGIVRITSEIVDVMTEFVVDMNEFDSNNTKNILDSLQKEISNYNDDALEYASLNDQIDFHSKILNYFEHKFNK